MNGHYMNHHRVRLPTGETCNYSLAYIMWHEMRYIANMPTKTRRNQYMEKLVEKRGETAAQKIRNAVLEFWDDLKPQPQSGDNNGGS
jgi:hypothetical protein